VTVSHQHADHNGAADLPNHFDVVSRAEERTAHGIKIRGIEAAHDNESGSVKGMVVIFVIEVDGMRVCHLGDLGHVLSSRQLEQIGSVDVLFVPVGGYYTIGPDQAHQVIKQLNPKIAIPMHFKTDKIDFPIQPVSDFIRGKDNVQVRPGSELEIGKEQLPTETIIIVLQHAL
jgi:L-ascorbate metabolism protein UlaG (beta-lactamase superfamily)